MAQFVVSKRPMAEVSTSCCHDRRKEITGVFVICLLFASVLLVNLAVGVPLYVGFFVYLLAK